LRVQQLKNAPVCCSIGKERNRATSSAAKKRPATSSSMTRTRSMSTPSSNAAIARAPRSSELLKLNDIGSSRAGLPDLP